MTSRSKLLQSFLLLAMVATSCATATNLDAVWRDPAATGGPAKSIVVLAASNTERQVRVYETGMTGPLTARKLKVIPGSSLFGVTLPDSATAVQKIKDSGADMVMLTRMIGVDNEQQYVPGSTYVSPGYGYGGYGGYYGYYSSSYMVMSDPGYIHNYKVFRLETNVYDVRTQKLVWSGVSSTSDPSSADDLMASFSNAVITDLVRNKILP